MREPQLGAVGAAACASASLWERAAAFCEQQGGEQGVALAAELRAQCSVAAPEEIGHRDFAMCEQLVAWNLSQVAPPIRVGSEYLVGMAAFSLCHGAHAGPSEDDVVVGTPSLPVLVVSPDQTYRVLPRELPEPMLQALALVTQWAPSDESGEDSDRTAVLEGWEALVELAPEVTLLAPGLGKLAA